MQEKTDNLWKKLKNGRAKEWLLVLLFAAILCFLAWVVFYEKKEETKDVLGLGTDTEKRLTAILEQIEGVGEVEVMISAEEQLPTVVIVCDGGKDLQVIMRVREAAAAAVGTKEQNVKIYCRDNN